MENISVHYEKGAREFAEALIGRAFTDEELAAAVGALDGSRLSVSIRKGVEIAVDVKHEKVIEQIRWLRRDRNAELYIWNFRLERARGYPGVGLESLVRQVQGARKMGFKRIECYAAGDPKSSDTGYHRWALYGFDAPLTQSEQFELWSLHFPGVRNLNELILLEGGDWWKEHGTERQMTFVLNENSSMIRVPKRYLLRKHPNLLKELI
jgi:hypothetical protein